jgi:hypothetical protein
MADLRNEIFEYAEGLYAKALQVMDEQRFRMADIYALSSYGAAVFVAADKAGPQEIRDRAAQLEQAAWTLARHAHAAERGRMIEPRMQGIDAESQELEAIRDDISAIAKAVFRHRRRR